MGKIAVRVREFKQEHSLGPYYAGEEIELNEQDLLQPHIRAAVITLDEERAEIEARQAAQSAERKARMQATEEQRASAIAAQKLAKARSKTADGGTE
jgi:patatin-like phospholipase/acyl hydrolase